MTSRASTAAVLLAAGTAVAAAVPAGAQNSKFVDKGPSFDCARARLVTEKLICRNEELAGLDLELADSFDAAVKKARGAAASRLRRDQVRWRASRDRCGGLLECLLTSYYQRLQELSPPGDATASRELATEGDGLHPLANVEAGFEDSYGGGAR